MGLALFINLHFIDSFLEFFKADFINVFEIHVLFFQFCQVAQVELFVDHHQLFQVEREEVAKEGTL